jgi:hypothetical protein
MLHEYHITSRYIQLSVLSAVSRNRGRSWNILSMDTGVRLYIVIYRLIKRSYIGSDWTGILFVLVAVQHSKFQTQLYWTNVEITRESYPVL